jgi:hypothetical protein
MSLDARFSPQVDVEHPWLGLESFSESTRSYFFGRDAEAAELLQRLRPHPLLVLYGRSGLGKTSLLRARLVPDLEKLGARPAFYRIGYGKGEDSPLEQLAVALEAGERISMSGFALPEDAASRLWLHVHRREHRNRITHLILDQFEEIFTLGAERPGADAEIRQALAIFVQGAIPPVVEALLDESETFLKHFHLDVPPLPVLLSLRQDYVFALNRWRSHLPQLGQNHFELRELRGPAAFDAVFKPGELRCHYGSEVSGETKVDTGLPPIVSKEIAKRIVHFAAKAEGDVPLEEIEAVPPILSLLCHELNERRFTEHGEVPGRPASQISFHEGETDIGTIIATFYERCLNGRPYAVRIFIEERLVSPYSGTRLQLDQRSILKVFADGCEIPGAADDRRAAGYGDSGAARACLENLVNLRLLTALGGGVNPGYELVHDLLAAVVEKSRTARQERLEKERFEHRANEAERVQRLEAERAEEAEKHAKEQKQSAIKLRRLAFVAAGAAAAALILLVVSVFLWRNSVWAADAAQRDLTDSFFRTIGVSDAYWMPPPRNEREALWQLAQLDRANAVVRESLLKRWFERAEAFMKGEARGGQGFRAATGLNLEYHRLSITGATELGRRLAAALENPQETDSDRLSSLGNVLAALAAKMDSQAVAEIVSRGANRLAAALENPQETNSDRLSSLGFALAALAARMEPQAAAQIANRGANRLAAALENPQETNSDRLSSLGFALEKLAAKMEPQAAAQIAKGLAVALESTPNKDSDRLRQLGRTLEDLAAEMEPQAAAQIAKGLAAALENPQEASYRLSILGSALAALAARMEPQAAAQIAKGLATVIENPQEADSYRLLVLGSALAALAAKMEPQAAAQIASQGANRLAAALENPHETILRLGSAVAKLAAKMESQAVAEIAKGLATALETETEDTRLYFLSLTLEELAAKIEPQAAAQIAEGVAAALEQTQETNFDRVLSLGNVLVALAARMEPQAAAQIASRGANRLAAALEIARGKNYNLLPRLGDALAALAAKMDSQAAAQIANRAANRLAAALENPQETNSDPSSLGNALAALAASMEPQAAAQIASRGANRLAAALENPQAKYSDLSSLGDALAALAARMEPQAAAEIAKGFATALESDPFLSLGNALAALAAKMEPQPAAEIARGLVAALENPQEADSDRLSILGKTLAAFCALLAFRSSHTATGAFQPAAHACVRKEG